MLERPYTARTNRFLIPMYIGTALITPPLRVGIGEKRGLSAGPILDFRRGGPA